MKDVSGGLMEVDINSVKVWLGDLFLSCKVLEERLARALEENKKLQEQVDSYRPPLKIKKEEGKDDGRKDN